MEQLNLSDWNDQKYTTNNVGFDKTTISEFQTPKDIARYMVNLLPTSAKLHVLEPTPGVGTIVRELRKDKHKVTAPKDYFF